MQINSTVNIEALEKLRSLVERGKLRVPVDSCWDMKDALHVRHFNLAFPSSLHELTL